MKLHVNRTCFHAGLKSQTDMSSFRLSCEHTLKLHQDFRIPGSGNTKNKSLKIVNDTPAIGL